MEIDYGLDDDDDNNDEDVLIMYKEKAANYTAQLKEKTIWEATQVQLKWRTLTVDIHHGKLNTLPASWRYPAK